MPLELWLLEEKVFTGTGQDGDEWETLSTELFYTREAAIDYMRTDVIGDKALPLVWEERHPSYWVANRVTPGEHGEDKWEVIVRLMKVNGEPSANHEQH